MDTEQIIIHSKNFLKPDFVTVKVTVELVEIVTSSLSEEKNTKIRNMEITCQSVAETFMQPNSTTEDFSASLMGLVNGSHKRLWRLANILDGTAQPCLV